MTTQTVLSTTLPVTILTPSTTQTTTPSPSTPLDLHLTYSTTTTTLTLTLSEFSTRILLLSQTITPTTYTDLRKQQNLTIDLPAFPAHLADLLTLPTREPRYAALLHLPPSPTPATLRIVEHHTFQVADRLSLELSHAPQQALVAALVARVSDARQRLREADTAREREAQAAADATGSVKAERDAFSQRLQARDGENAALVERLAEAEAARATADAAAADADARAREAEEARAAAERAAAGLRADVNQRGAELTAARSELAAARTAAEQARAAVAAVAGERDAEKEVARREGEAVRRLQGELRAVRARDRVKFEVISRQEETVRALERDLRRARDRAAMLDVEKEGLGRRLTAASGKLEESLAVQESDQQVIAYLNRELNRRVIGDGEGEGAEGEGGGVQRNVEVTSR